MTALSQALLAHSPLGLYKLDDASGHPQDSSGNANHFTNNGGGLSYQVAQTAFPGAGTVAMRGDGTANGWTDKAPFADRDNATIFALAKRNASGELGICFASGNVFTVVNAWGLTLGEGVGTDFFAVYANGNVAKADAVSTLSQWYSLAAVLTGGNAMTLYVNGVLQAAPTTFNPAGISGSDWIFGMNNAILAADMSVSHAAYIPSALTAAQILALHNTALGSYPIINGGAALTNVNDVGDDISTQSYKSVPIYSSEMAALLLAEKDVAIVGYPTTLSRARRRKFKIAADYEGKVQILGVTDITGFVANSWALGEVDATAHTLSDFTGGILESISWYGDRFDAFGNGVNQVLAVWADTGGGAPGALVGYGALPATPGASPAWQTTTSLTLLREGRMPAGVYHIGTLVPNLGVGTQGQHTYAMSGGASVGFTTHFRTGYGGTTVPPDPGGMSSSVSNYRMAMYCTVRKP